MNSDGFEFVKPRHAQFAHYCGECGWWRFVKSAGAAVRGICDPYPELGSAPREKDAYEPMCGLFLDGGKR